MLPHAASSHAQSDTADSDDDIDQGEPGRRLNQFPSGHYTREGSSSSSDANSPVAASNSPASAAENPVSAEHQTQLYDTMRHPVSPGSIDYGDFG